MPSKVSPNATMASGTFLSDNSGLGGDSSFSEATGQSGSASMTSSAASGNSSAQGFANLTQALEIFLFGDPKQQGSTGFDKTLYDSMTQDTSGLQEQATQDITPS